jgi:hypothetical protein
MYGKGQGIVNYKAFDWLYTSKCIQPILYNRFNIWYLDYSYVTFATKRLRNQARVIKRCVNGFLLPCEKGKFS